MTRLDFSSLKALRNEPPIQGQKTKMGVRKFFAIWIAAVFVLIFAGFLIIAVNQHSPSQPAVTEETSASQDVEESVKLGTGAARVWYLKAYKQLSEQGELNSIPKLPYIISGTDAYQLGLLYAPQFQSDPVNQEKFARAFEAELKRLIWKWQTQ